MQNPRVAPAVAFALVTLAMSISLVVAGVLSGIIGPGWTVAVIAALNIAWGTGFLILTRGIRAEAESEALAAASGHTVVTELDPPVAPA